MLRLLPRSRWALLRLGLLAGLTLVVLPPRWWAAQARYTLAFFLKNRLRDRAGVINFADQWRFERFLQQIEDESGADIRVLLVPRVSGESLEMFSVREARAAGVGQGVDRRGLFFVYDAEGHRARIEVGTQLEGIITDAFAGYLIRDHVRSFFGTGSPSFGLRTTLMMVQQRLREAVLGREYDPELLAFIGDARRLAVGGGATGTTQVTQASAFLNRSEPSGRAPAVLRATAHPSGRV